MQQNDKIIAGFHKDYTSDRAYSSKMLNLMNSLKNREMNKNKVTVVTVVFNNIGGIRATIESVINQTLPCEYIIIDGESTDGTVDIIKEYDAYIDYWVSKPDNGIYDAMNKGIKAATGEWILFMNSGDTFHNEYVLERIFSQSYNDNVGVIWGNTDLYREGKYVTKYKNRPFYEHLSTAFRGVGICHQSTFVRTSLAKQLMFDTSYRITADFNMMYLIYKQGYTFVHNPITISHFDLSGVSSTNASKIFLTETKRVIHNKYNRLYYWCQFIYYIKIKKIAKRILGRK